MGLFNKIKSNESIPEAVESLVVESPKLVEAGKHKRNRILELTQATLEPTKNLTLEWQKSKDKPEDVQCGGNVECYYSYVGIKLKLNIQYFTGSSDFFHVSIEESTTRGGYRYIFGENFTKTHYSPDAEKDREYNICKNVFEAIQNQTLQFDTMIDEMIKEIQSQDSGTVNQEISEGKVEKFESMEDLISDLDA